MKLTKTIIAVVLLVTSIDFAEAAPVAVEPASAAAATLQLPPPPPPPGLPRFGRRRRYVRHRRVVRHRSRGFHFRLPPPPPHPPLP